MSFIAFVLFYHEIPSFHDFIILIVGLFKLFIRVCTQKLSKTLFSIFYQSNSVISNDVSEPCNHFYLYQTPILLFIVFPISVHIFYRPVSITGMSLALKIRMNTLHNICILFNIYFSVVDH